MADQKGTKRTPLMLPPALDEPADAIDDQSESTDQDWTEPGFAQGSTWSMVRKTLTHVESFAQKTEAESDSDIIEPSSMEGFTSIKPIDIPGYSIKKQLGRGGMGVVYLARDEHLERLVAIKMLAAHATHLRDRFDSEIRAVAALKHPNIAQLYASNEMNGVPFFVMEYVDGESLESHLNNKPKDPRDAAELVTILAQAIEYTHQQGLLHRDLKPSNVLLASDGTPKIADFGLAKSVTGNSSATQTGEILGTPSYMAPEQASGVVKKLTEACDVYGLGGILYKLITGHAPFESPDPMQTVMSVIADEPLAPRRLQNQIPRDLENICLKCLAKAPGRRYASAAELANDLSRFLRGQPVEARAVSWPERTTKWCRRHPAAASLLTAVILLTGLALGGLSLHNRQLSDEVARSERLIASSNKFAQWISQEHLAELQKLLGSTPVRGELADQLQKHLDELSTDAKHDVEYNFQLALSFKALADVQGNPNIPNMGKLDQAIENYDRSIELTEESLRRSPSLEKAKHGLISTMLNKFDVVLSRDGLSQAEEILNVTETRFQKMELEEGDPLVVTRFMTEQRWCDIESSRQQLTAAESRLNRMEELLGELSEDEEIEEKSINMSLYLFSKRADIRMLINKLELAETDANKALELSSQIIAAEPENVAARKLHGELLRTIADVQYELRKVEETLATAKEAASFNTMLNELNPEDAGARYRLALDNSRIASAYLLKEDYEQTAVFMEKSVEFYRSLIADFPKDSDYIRGLSVELNGLANSYMLVQDLDKSFELRAEAIEIVGRLLDHDDENYFDLALRAEMTFNLALAKFSLFLQETVDAKQLDPQGAEIVEIEELIATSLADFRKIEKNGEVNKNLQVIFDNAIDLEKMVPDYVKQINDTNKPSDSSSDEDQIDDC